MFLNFDKNNELGYSKLHMKWGIWIYNLKRIGILSRIDLVGLSYKPMWVWVRLIMVE
jgi:hypothetical protein